MATQGTALPDAEREMEEVTELVMEIVGVRDGETLGVALLDRDRVTLSDGVGEAVRDLEVVELTERLPDMLMVDDTDTVAVSEMEPVADALREVETEMVGDLLMVELGDTLRDPLNDVDAVLDPLNDVDDVFKGDPAGVTVTLTVVVWA